MGSNWIVEEAKKIDNSKDIVILEKPDTKNYLDDILINRFWPAIHESLENTGYNYSPQDIALTEFELGYELTRSLTFILFDYKKAIFRGKLCCSASDWMLESDFFLQLSEETDLAVIFEIIGDPQFRGFPPTLEIRKDMPYVYQILFHSGNGADWSVYDDNRIYDRIDEVINTNVKLYEFSKYGYISRRKVGEFLLLAYKVYEAY